MSLWQLIKPEATTNLITNPSFEQNETGWAASGTNTIGRDTTTAKFGVVSLKCTYTDSTTLASYTTSASTFPTTSTTYTASGWVYVPSSWDGGDIEINVDSLTSASVTVNHQYTEGTSSKGAWVYLESSITIVTDVVGSLTVVTDSAPTAAEFVYIDGVQLEEKAYVTTYCDGDQDGCEWTAGEHASTSTRSVRSYQGGRIRVLDDDFSVHVNGAVGIGAPQLDTNISELGLSPGGHHQSSRYRTRNWQLLCQINGSSLANLHALKRAFVKELDPRRLGEFTTRGTPVRLRYTGGADDVYIDAYYTGGAEFTGRRGFSETMPIRFASPDPFFRTIGDVAKVLDSEDTATFSVWARRDETGTWNNLGNPTVISGTQTYQMAQEADGTVWVATGMDIDESGSTYLFTYDPVGGTYSAPLSTNPNAEVHSLCVASDGTVYAGGDFTTIDGVSANRFASYNGTTWSAAGTGLNGICHVIKQGPDGLIYAGGAFTTAGGTTVRGVATWNGTTWAALGPPSSGGTVYDLAWDRSDNLYVVGSFTNWNGAGSSDYIAKWDGSSWSSVTTAVFNGAINAIQPDDTGNFYVAGAFTTFGSATYNRVAYFNGTTFEEMATGVNGEARALEFDHEGRLWVGGEFTQAGQNTLADRMAIWRRGEWAHTDIDISGSPIIRAFMRSKKQMYLAGDIDSDNATYAGSATVTNEGSTLTYPVIYISRAGGTAATLDSLTNATTGAQLLFNYQFLDGEVLRIDLRPGRRRMFSSVYGEGWKLLPFSDVAGFSFPVGDSTITSFFRTTGSPTMTVWAIWQQTHLGVD